MQSGRKKLAWILGSLALLGLSFAFVARLAPHPGVREVVYSVETGKSLNEPAPLFLSRVHRTNWMTEIIQEPAHGRLEIHPTGAFIYAPNPGFAGIDSFVCRPADSSRLSATTMVTLAVTPVGALFFDDFSRLPTETSLKPWVPKLGYWKIESGVLKGASERAFADAYLAGDWTNFSVQARIQLPTAAFGGGLGGRVSAKGTKYVVNVYPNGRFDAPGKGPVMRLLKFHDWTTLGPEPMKQVSVPEMGTNWHTLRVTFVENRIRVYLDGTGVMDVTDEQFDGLPAFRSGGITAHLFTYHSHYVMAFDDVTVWPEATTGVEPRDRVDATAPQTVAQ